MPLKINDKVLKVCKGNKNIKSVMIGINCVYGNDLKKLNINYPFIQKGSGLTIDVNGSNKISNPTTDGALKVQYGDNITIRTYAEVGYINPNSAVIMGKKSIIGEDYALRTEGISVTRATTYTFVIKGDVNLILSEALLAPKARIYINKDNGVDRVSFNYYKGPYEYNGLEESDLSTQKYSISTSENVIELLLYNKIISTTNNDKPRWIAKEGYKISSKTQVDIELLTEVEQGTISAFSEEGEKVSIICPPAPIGINEYSLNVISSEYSRDIKSYDPFYTQSSSTQQQTLWLRHRDQFNFYKGDIVRITAIRKNGYKLPTLGKLGDTSLFVRNKEITLSAENILILESGEQGIPISLINNPLPTTEHVYLSVVSEYSDNLLKIRNPQLYVGDEISIPLSHNYRMGTSTHRKPGVGIRAEGRVLIDVTFTSNIFLKVPNVNNLSIDLIQGKKRGVYSPQSLGTIAEFYRLTNISSMQIKYFNIRDKNIIPEENYGTEDFFIDSFKMTYSCKRYLMDVNMSEFIKITQWAVPKEFSYDYEKTVFKQPVIIGKYQFDDDMKGITLSISKYDTDWVANTGDQGRLIIDKIII